MGWPGRNNPSFESINGFELLQDRDFAPFVDLDGDNVYEPLDGEYPAIKGDQNHWYLMNDFSGPHFNSRATPLIMEIGVMAYSSASNEDVINKTTFYDFSFLNKSNQLIKDFHFGFFLDFDFNCPLDDYLVFDEENNMLIAYDEDSVDSLVSESCAPFGNEVDSGMPMLAVALIDDLPSKGLSHGIVSQNTNSSPSTISNLDNIVKYSWDDGTPFTYGGVGYNPGSTDTVQFLYPDDPSDPNGWSMCNSGFFGTSNNAFMLSGDHRLETNQKVTSTFAVILVDNVDTHCPSLDPIRDALDIVNSYKTIVDVVDITENISVNIYPNPTGDFISVESEK